MKNGLLKTFSALFFCLAVPLMARAGDALPEYALSVSFEPEKNLLRGKAVVSLPEDRGWEVLTGELKVIEARVNGAPLDLKAINKEKRFTAAWGGKVEIIYEGVFKEYETDVQNVGVAGSVVSPQGISLIGAWYPAVGDMAYYSLTATVPEDFTAVSEANSVIETSTPEGKRFVFRFGHPSEGMSLAAGRFKVAKGMEGDVLVYAYFFEEDAELAEKYVEYTKSYIRMYEEMLGPYPYGRFSVVENFLPTGVSMATFTLLGQDVVRLPFIVETSLGHEVLHQWFGNSVYGDTSGGNWLEGITTYLADHLYEERKGQGASYRKRAMADYQSYVLPDRAFTLKEFQGRVDPASKAIGYGKGAMVLHMLKERVGEEAFLGTLKSFVREKRFKRASWADIRAAFERESGEGLELFFEQWVGRKDVPYIEVKDPRILYIDGAPNVSFKLSQRGEKPYALRIKAKITTDKGERVETLDIEDMEKSFRLPVEGTPVEMFLDPEYDIMRALWPEEFPPAIARLLGDEKKLIVIPYEGVGDYIPLTSLLKDKGFDVKPEDEVKDADLLLSSVLLLGADGPIHRRLFGRSPVEAVDEGFAINVMKNPLNPAKVLAVASASGREEVEAAARKVFHYGRFSRLRFRGGNNVLKEAAPSDAGMRVRFEHKVSGVKPSSALSLDNIIREIIDRDIIYVGESHASYEDHRVQLDVVRALDEAGRKFAVGMEMFQRQFQGALDDYVSGKTNEREFLKASEYFKRWRFDYHLYREIINYAKARGIPIVALNTDSEIIKKVSDGGLDALSKEEKEKIPADMDMSDEGYRKLLMRVFDLHEDVKKGKTFDNFYQSQLLWDETMAHSVDEFMRKNPGYQMVVLAGMGHIGWGSGIPKRAYRLNGKPYATLINSNVDTMEEGIADYVLFPERLKPPESPRLGVMLAKAEEGVLIEEVQAGSNAGRADIREGDVLTSIDGFPVREIEDVKIALFDRSEGEALKVKLLRKRFLLGMKEVAIEVRLR